MKTFFSKKGKLLRKNNFIIVLFINIQIILSDVMIQNEFGKSASQPPMQVKTKDYITPIFL